MYQHVEWDKATESNVIVEDFIPKRTHHGDIQPSAVRIQSYKHKLFGKKYQDAVEGVRRKDYELGLLKKQKTEHGLMTA